MLVAFGLLVIVVGVLTVVLAGKISETARAQRRSGAGGPGPSSVLIYAVCGFIAAFGLWLLWLGLAITNFEPT